MGLPRFVAPDDSVAVPFWRALDSGRLELPRCSECGAWQWYPDEAVTCCAGGSLQWQEVSGIGTVYSKTRVVRAFLPDGADDVPFDVLLVDLDDADGVRLLANTLDDTVEISDRVRLATTPVGTRQHPVFERLNGDRP